MALDPEDIDVTTEEETTETVETEKVKKAPKKADEELEDEEEEEEEDEEKRKSVESEEDALTAHEVIKDLSTLGRELRDIVKMRAIDQNRQKGNKNRMSKSDIVKSAYVDPMPYLTEREFLALEKAATALLPFFRRGPEMPYPNGNKKPYPYPKPGVKKSEEAEDDDFATAPPKLEADQSGLSKSDAEAIRKFVTDTAPKMFDVLSTLANRK